MKLKNRLLIASMIGISYGIPKLPETYISSITKHKSWNEMNKGKLSKKQRRK